MGAGTPIAEDDKLAQLVNQWEKSCTNTESTLHQLSPYIGKPKSSIAKDLILNYSRPGELIVDPFAGSGTVLLEAVRLGRRALGVDISPYAALLSRAKLSAPNTLDEALNQAKERLAVASLRPQPDNQVIPPWVKSFFHPDTLSEAINFADECQEQKDDFLLACMLGILHHQRPGFLSYPSSHLTPYLRDKKFPKDQFPHLYQYRALEPRLLAKVERAYKRKEFHVAGDQYSFVLNNALETIFPDEVGCFITSPPYMNALDYGRDNRLRLWFIDKQGSEQIDRSQSQQREGFQELMEKFSQQAVNSLLPNGHCIVIVGDQLNKQIKFPLSKMVLETFKTHAPKLHLIKTIENNIPDIRRARRDHRGVRTENFLFLRRKMPKQLPPYEQFLNTPVEGDGDFSFTHYIGRGCYALVFRGDSATLNQSAAYKIIPSENLAPGERWKIEPRKANSLEHPSVVHCQTYFDWREQKGIVVLKYDFVDGISLYDYIKTNKNQITIPFIKSFLVEMLGLFYELQQRGIQHGDFHSRNILVTKPSRYRLNSTEEFRVTDFGIGGLTSDAELTDDYEQLARVLGQLLDSIDYQTISPEEKYAFNILSDHFKDKHLIEKDCTRDPVARNPALLLEHLERIETDYEKIQLTSEGFSLLTPFDYLSCEQIGQQHSLLRALYSNKFLGISEIESANNLVVTGPVVAEKALYFVALVSISNYIPKKTFIYCLQ